MGVQALNRPDARDADAREIHPTRDLQDCNHLLDDFAALTASGQATPRFTQVEYVDGATLTLRNAGGQTVTLRRQKETTATFCP